MYKNKVKKAISILLCMAMVFLMPFATINASASGDIMGDVDGYGMVTSADARLALRFSSRLITLTTKQQRLADIDFDGTVTAADARIILRISSRLEQPIDQTPCAWSVTSQYASKTWYPNEYHIYPAADVAYTAYKVAGYNSYLETQPTVDIMRGKHDTGRKRMSSDILFFAGHANYNHMAFEYMRLGGDYLTGIYYTAEDFDSPSGYKYAGLGNMVLVNLVTFAGCYTAKGDENLASRAVDFGATAAVGWTWKINYIDAVSWLREYNSKLADGFSVAYAIAYANSEAVFPFTAAASVKHYGDTTLKINNNRSGELEFANLIDLAVKNAVVVTACQVDVDAIANIISASIRGFDVNEYKILPSGEIYDGFYTVHYIKMIDDYETNSVITAVVRDGILTDVVDKSIASDSRKSELSLTKPSTAFEKTALKAAEEECLASGRMEVITQEVRYFYDIDKNEKSIFIFTEYCYDGTTAKGVHTYKVIID